MGTTLLAIAVTIGIAIGSVIRDRRSATGPTAAWPLLSFCAGLCLTMAANGWLQGLSWYPIAMLGGTAATLVGFGGLVSAARREIGAAREAEGRLTDPEDLHELIDRLESKVDSIRVRPFEMGRIAVTAAIASSLLVTGLTMGIQLLAVGGAISVGAIAVRGASMFARWRRTEALTTRVNHLLGQNAEVPGTLDTAEDAPSVAGGTVAGQYVDTLGPPSSAERRE